MRGEPGRFGRMRGLNDMLRRLAEAREDLLSRYQLGDMLADVRQELDEIVATERRGIERRLTRPAETATATRSRSQDLAESLAERRQRQLETTARRHSAVGSAACRTTTSSSPKRAIDSRRCSTSCAGRCSTPTSPVCPTR